MSWVEVLSQTLSRLSSSTRSLLSQVNLPVPFFLQWLILSKFHLLIVNSREVWGSSPPVVVSVRCWSYLCQQFLQILGFNVVQQESSRHFTLLHGSEPGATISTEAGVCEELDTGVWSQSGVVVRTPHLHCNNKHQWSYSGLHPDA